MSIRYENIRNLGGDLIFGFKSDLGELRVSGKDCQIVALVDRDALDEFGFVLDNLLRSGKSIAGFTSYECFRSDGRECQDWPYALFVAFDRSEAVVRETIVEEDDPNARHSLAHVIDDPVSLADFGEKVGTVGNWIAADRRRRRRLTISRKVVIPGNVAIDHTYQRLQPSGLSRAFMFNNGRLRIVGQSPELLIKGCGACFETHKLAGTAATSSSHSICPEVLKGPMSNSKELVYEHELSVAATLRSLKRCGSAVRVETVEREFTGIRHLATTFRTVVSRNMSLWRILREVAPTGSSGERSGHELLKTLESTERGPYYGLLGFAHPDGSMEFAQTLRAIYGCKHGIDDALSWYAQVGAAITTHSTTKGESDETRLKLDQIRFCRAD
ncbi:chorismate-binding protein [Burkholderia pyrrocinia]|uniref:chorismate-binding protein n=1 Tax=Burkholderia pyrrocinia TaxID=60550 RepID=UPI002AB1359E|nr:chorismate-binding protein [Burkholderia pyrrocinia]